MKALTEQDQECVALSVLMQLVTSVFFLIHTVLLFEDISMLNTISDKKGMIYCIVYINEQSTFFPTKIKPLQGWRSALLQDENHNWMLLQQSFLCWLMDRNKQKVWTWNSCWISAEQSKSKVSWQINALSHISILFVEKLNKNIKTLSLWLLSLNPHLH